MLDRSLGKAWCAVVYRNLKSKRHLVRMVRPCNEDIAHSKSIKSLEGMKNSVYIGKRFREDMV